MRIHSLARGEPLLQSPTSFSTFLLGLKQPSQICDVAEAYRTIPVTPEQWPGLVVKLLGDDQFTINICNNFGLTSAGGIYGHLGDAMLDIFCAHGISPASKWVDDHIFFRVLITLHLFSSLPPSVFSSPLLPFFL